MHEVIATICFFVSIVFVFIFCNINDKKNNKIRIEKQKILYNELENKYPKLFDTNNWELDSHNKELIFKLNGEVWKWNKQIPHFLSVLFNVEETIVFSVFLNECYNQKLQIENDKIAEKTLKLLGEEK